MVTVAVLLSRMRKFRLARLIANGSTVSFPRCWCRACCCKRCWCAGAAEERLRPGAHRRGHVRDHLCNRRRRPALGSYPHIRVFARGGAALIFVVVVQMLLGGISLAVRTPPAVDSPSAEQLQSSDAMQPRCTRWSRPCTRRMPRFCWAWPRSWRFGAGGCARQLAAKQQRGRNRRRLRLLDLRVANLHCLLQALQCVLILGVNSCPT